jgi:hypothetical protein
MTLIEMLRANGSWEADAAATRIQSQDNRIEKLEAALDDVAQYISRADWHYLKDETRNALEGKDE